MYNRRPYTAGHFELQLDGHPTTAYVKSVDFGMIKAGLVEESHGSDLGRIKHLSTFEVEPITLEVGMAGAGAVLRWIRDSWRREYSRRNGSIIHANFNLDSTYEYEFFDALIVETTFPQLDGSSKDGVYLKLKIQPTYIRTKTVSGTRLLARMGHRQKAWLSSAFRFTIDGIEGLEFTNKLESFTIKQGIRKFFCGEERLPECEPVKLDFPNLAGTLALSYADQLLAWQSDYLSRGLVDPVAQRTGSIEFLTPDRNSTNLRIRLGEVGMHNLTILHSQANSEQLKRAKFELFVGEMDLEATNGFDG